MAIYVYQIYYDENTRKIIDPSFLPLDNSKSERPDWYEYWPVRSVLLNNSFADSDYLGFFSPRFLEKTGYTGDAVKVLVERSSAEVVAFSPQFVQIALHQNSFLQGEIFQPGLLGVSEEVLEVIGLGLDLKNLWQDQARTVYANYFLARYSFWKKWLGFSEKIFEICEGDETPLSAKLTSFTRHRGKVDHYQMKVFIMERLVSALLEKLNINAASKFNFSHQRKDYVDEMKRLGRAPVDFGRFLLLDALKGQYIRTGQVPYLNLFRHYLSNEVK
jgi:hypothetical protein